MDKGNLRQRTKKFALKILRLVNNLPKNRITYVLGNQILKSGTSVGANYRAACRARSRAEFIAKMGIVLEESDETVFWLELMLEIKLIESQIAEALLKECNEITAMTVSSIKTAKFSAR